MSKKAARFGDLASNHGAWHPSPVMAGSGNVFINGLPAARKGDMVAPHVQPNSPPHGRSIAAGSSGVFINGKPAARVGDAISCGGKVMLGSGNVFIGDKAKSWSAAGAGPKAAQAKVKEVGHHTELKDAKAYQTLAYTPTQLGPSDGPTSNAAPSHKNDTEVRIIGAANSSPNGLELHKQSAINYWQNHKDNADNFPEYLAAHLMGLNAETGYDIAEGIQATFELATDWDALKGATAQFAEGVVDIVTDPVNTFNNLKATVSAFNDLTTAQKGDAVYKMAIGTLAAAGAGKATSATAKALKSKLPDATTSKKITPASLAHAEQLLSQRRQQIASDGYLPKYTDEELALLAQHGDVGEERFQVRFMDAGHLQNKNTPDIPLSGALGVTMQGATGKGAKYWSTSFDQLEDADTDPSLIAAKLGLDYSSDANYALIIIDTEIAQPLTGVKSVPATFDEVGKFAYQELPADFDQSVVDKIMTPEFQAEYKKHYAAATPKYFKEWSTDADKFEDYLRANGIDEDNIELYTNRMLMHKKVGNNHKYLGTGLTEDLNPNSPNNDGAVETLNFERKEINLKQLHDAGAVKIITGLKPL